MNLLKFSPTLLLLLAFASCQKEAAQDNPFQNEPNSQDLSSLTIPQSFNWSSSLKGELHISLDAPANFSTQGSFVELMDVDNTVLDRRPVVDAMVSFYISVPQDDEKYFAYYPNTQEKIELTHVGNVSFPVAQVDFTKNPNALIANRSYKKNGVKAKTASNLVTNGDFEAGTVFPMDANGTTILRTVGEWYAQNTEATVSIINGNNVFTSNGTSSDKGRALQAFDIGKDVMVDVAYDYSGQAGVNVIFFNDQMQYVGYTIVSAGSGNASANFITPKNVKFIQLYAFAANGEYVDNVSLSKTAEPDDDNDGVYNRQDKFPNDPMRAFASSFPSKGTQTLAFEDLWPSQGDFDFNDMVITNRVDFAKNSNSALVDAIFTVKVDGMGAGVGNGLAVALYKSDKSALNQNIIASVNGDAKIDPAVQNGIIVFDNVKTALKPFYNNNGHGPEGAPQTFTFTVTFNAAAGNLNLLPDFYIFRSSERGREIHIPGFAGTAAADASLFNTKADVNGTYKTATGLPWGVEIVSPENKFFHHPLEGIDICEAYQYFQQWAESSGTNYVGWMIHSDKSKVYSK